MTGKIDDIDRKIIALLRDNSRCSAKEIARETGMPVTTVFNRIKKLEKEEVIKQYSIVVDEKKLGRGLAAYILLHYNPTVWGKSSTRQELKRRLLAIPHIEEAKYLLGQYDILLKVRAKDIDELNNLILSGFRKIPGIGTTETFIVLEDVK